MAINTLEIKFAIGNFLYKHFFPIYKVVYNAFKKNQDKHELDLIGKHLKPGHTVLDIGANIGFYTNIFSGMVGKEGKVFAFEPDPTNFKHLTNNCKHLTNVTLYPYAISDADGILTLYTSKKLNVDHRTYKPDSFDEEIKIESKALDDFLHFVPKIDFIKIDIQGFEVQAFAGMRNILKNNKGIKILSELSPSDLKQAGSSTRAFVEILKSSGLMCYFFDESSLKSVDDAKIRELEKFEDNPEKYFNVFIY